MGGLGGGEYILSPSNLLNGEHELHLGNTTYGGHRRCTWRSTNNIKKKFMVSHSLHAYKMVKVKWSRYRLGVAQRVGRGIALLFHDRGTRRRWVVSSTPRPHFSPGKDPVPILQEAGWAPGSVWTGGKSRPHRDSIPDLPARRKSLYRLSYPAHTTRLYHCLIHSCELHLPKTEPVVSGTASFISTASS